MIKYGLQEEQITSIQNILAQHQEVEQAILYGSRAKGNYKPASDIDLVLKGEKLNLTILNKIANELDDLLLPYIFDLSIFHQISNEELVEHIERVGVVFYIKLSDNKKWDLTTTKLGKFADVQNGYAFKSNEFVTEGIPVIKIKNIVSPNINLEDAQYYNGEESERLRQFIVSKNDILISMTGSHLNQIASAVGKVGRYKYDFPALLNQRVGKVYITDNTIGDQDFLYYFLNRFETQVELVGSASGSANQANISPAQIKNLEIPLPQLPIQKKIASILKSLDDKIELNRQVNQTLEEIAKTLFQEMCVPKGDELPEGWRVGKLGEVCRNVRNTVSPQTMETDTAYVGLEHIPRRSLALSDFGTSSDVSSQKSSFRKYDILFGKLRPYFHKVCIAPFAGICSTDILVIEPIDAIYFSFCLNHLYSDELIKYVSSIADGTRMPRVDWKSISDYEVAIPDIDTIKRLNEICLVNYERLIQSTQESHALAESRDSLLPKLMNGELKINVLYEQTSQL